MWSPGDVQAYTRTPTVRRASLNLTFELCFLTFDLQPLLLRHGSRWKRRDDGSRGPLLGRLRFTRGRRRLRTGRRGRLVDRETRGNPLDLLGVERLASEQRIRHIEHALLVLADDRLRARVIVGHEALDLLVDAQRRVLAVVLMLRDLAAEEDLLFLLAERQRPHRRAHAPFEIGRAHV